MKGQMTGQRVSMTPRRFVIDRLEDDGWAVLEAEGSTRSFTIPRAWLPASVREGDVILVELPADGTLKMTVDGEETTRVRERMRSLRDSLPRGPSGDIEL
jgi:hypothetical protein